jgi:ABC-type transporter MlaC component
VSARIVEDVISLRCWPRWCAVRVGVVLVLAVIVVDTTCARDASAGAPTDALRDFFGAVNVVLNDPRTADQPMEKLRAIRRHVDDTVDFREAAMLALGREWHAHTALEQNEFVALFADLLERSFVWRVAGKASLGGGVRVDYLGETVTGDIATVETALAGRDGNHFRLEFRMVRRGERWVVRDIVLDGVSTMENYHAQFQRIVRDASWPELIGQLRAKVGVPTGGVHVAAAAPVVAPPPAAPAPVVAPLPAPVVAPLRPVDVADRPGADLPHAIARDVAAVVTTAPREAPGGAARETAPSVREAPVVAQRQAAPPVRDTPPPLPVAPAHAPNAARETAPSLRDTAPAPVLPLAPAASREVVAPAPAPAVSAAPVTAPILSPDSSRVAAVTPARPLEAPRAASGPPALAAAVTPPRSIEPPRTVSAPTRTAVAPAVWIQVGAYKTAATAGRVADNVKGEILVVARPAAGAGAEPLLRVRVGPFPDRAQATARLREIRALGYQPFLAVGD